MKEKYFLGFSLGFNASAALMSNKKGVVAAISQERLSGEKNTKEIPFDAMIECCKVAGVNRVENITFSHYQLLTWAELKKYSSEKYIELVRDYENDGKTFGELFEAVLENENITLDNNDLVRVEHHSAHAASAYAIYGKADKYIAFTSDGFGDGVSARIVMYNKDRRENPKTFAEYPLADSVALVYQFVTGALGYKMHQHEGKITGLAAYGNPEKYLFKFEELHRNGCILNEVDVANLDKLETDEEFAIYNASKDVIEDFDVFCKLKKTVFGIVADILENNDSFQVRADIAAAVQMYAEERTIEMLRKAVKKAEINSFFDRKEFDDNGVCYRQKVTLYLAGGLFANVKINQKIQERFAFKETIVSPPMGDEGTSIGAAYIRMIECVNYSQKNFTRNVYLGTEMEFGEKQINEYGVNSFADVREFKSVGCVEQVAAIAKLLAQKKIVCLCHGRMEFGPRALCHRSILYDCTDKDTNKWLNDQLGRTEFMPFAPVCLVRNSGEFFEDMWKMRSETLRYMTMTLKCSKKFIETYPAAVHIDGTARPQILCNGDDIFMEDILRQYEIESEGKCVLINTSFNLHNNPIIESCKTAIDSWLASNTHALVINNYLLIRRDI